CARDYYGSRDYW
nr:immunoglobulin heavy chain junction region [Mus musculus]